MLLWGTLLQVQAVVEVPSIPGSSSLGRRPAQGGALRSDSSPSLVFKFF